MISYAIILGVGIVAAVVAIGVLFVLGGKAQSGAKEGLKKIGTHLDKQRDLKTQIEELYGSMVDLGSMRNVVQELRGLFESLKAERGRITITQAELETVETRLRELEEIERELEASAIETKEELNILQKKEAELKSRNDTLKTKIKESTTKIDALMGEVEMSAQVEEQIIAMKTQLLETEQKIDQLLLQVEGGNEQYFILKQRYDALDIEYAQLYEKFSEAEGGGE